MLRMFRRIPFALSAAAVIVGTAFAYDPYLPNTVLEIHGNNTTNLVCDDVNNAITNNGVTIVGEGVDKYAVFGGNSNITTPYSAKYDWWKNDYTIEMWVNASSWATWSYFDSNYKPVLITNGNQTGPANYWGFGPVADGRVGFYYFNGAPIWLFSTSTLSNNTWHHIALTVSNNTIKIIINGVIAATAPISGTPQASGSYPINIGKANNTSINGSVRNIRITNGVNRYPANFDVADVNNDDYRSADYYWDSTIFLMDGNTVTDVRGNAITNFGVSSSSAEKLFTDNSIYFNGNSAFRINNPNPNFTFNSGDFSIEFNFKSLIEQIDKVLIGFRTPGNPNGLVISTGGNGGTSNGVLRVSNGGTNIAVSTSRIDTGAWARCAVVRKDGVIYVLVNGKLEGSGAFAGSIAPVANRPIFGANDFQDVPSSNFVTGYFDGIRVTKVARHITSYSVDSSAFPDYGVTGPAKDVYWKYTKLALTDGLVESTGLTLNNNSNMVTTNNYAGKDWAYFNGTNTTCRLSATDAALNFGDKDFTIELEYIPEAKVNPYPIIFSNYNVWNGGTGLISIMDRHNSAPGVFSVLIGGSVYASNVSVVDGTKYHLAFARKGNVWTFYINGKVVFTTTVALTGLAGGVIHIGNTLDGSGTGIKGRIRNYWITIGVCRYNGEFISPVYDRPIVG